MPLGFQEEYSLSNYSREEFIEVWSEIAPVAKELIDYILESFDVKKVLLPQESTELIRYIRGALFILGFDEADKGEYPDLYDENVSISVAKTKEVMRQLKLVVNNLDSIDYNFITNLSQIFSITDETKVAGIWRVLNTSAVKNAKPLMQVSKKPGAPSKTGLAATAVPSSVKKGEGVNPGTNYPKDDSLAKLSTQYSLAKDGEKKLSANFKVSDFKCKDGSDVILINPNLIPILEKIREHFGKPVNINSGYRTPSYNRKTQGAAKNSQHMYGNAADISIKGVTPLEIYKWLRTWHTGGLGLYDTFVHVDVRDLIGLRTETWDNRKSKPATA